MSPQKNDLVICIETGSIGIILSNLPGGRIKISFSGDVAVLEKEDIIILRRPKNAEM